jgi:hypothetical protein
MLEISPTHNGIYIMLRSRQGTHIHTKERKTGSGKIKKSFTNFTDFATKKIIYYEIFFMATLQTDRLFFKENNYTLQNVKVAV